MKYLALLLIFGFGLSGFGQTIKTLGYNTTNGQVVANTGTNVLTFTNPLNVSSQRINIGEGLGFWDTPAGEYALFFQADDPVILAEGRWNDPSVRASLGFSTNLNTLWTATNASNARTAVGLGETNNVKFNALHVERDADSSNFTLTIGTTNTGFKGVGGGPSDFVFSREGVSYLGILGSGLDSYVTHKFYAPLSLRYGAGATAVLEFDGINAATGAAISRTNLGLGSGITTNRTFVSYNGTNYTTNTVTISNGIITGWTQ